MLEVVVRVVVPLVVVGYCIPGCQSGLVVVVVVVVVVAVVVVAYSSMQFHSMITSPPFMLWSE